MENNFIFSSRGEGKTEFITKLANDLYRKGGYKIDFYSMTSETLPNLERGISYNIYPNNIVNKKYILDLKKEKIKFGKLDILFIDDINFLDDWDELLSLECDKFITVDILDPRLSKIERLSIQGDITHIKPEWHEKTYNSTNLFHLNEIQYSNLINPYLRDKKINTILQ